jgi:hypothetical protein
MHIHCLQDKWIPCYHIMERSQVAHAEDSLQIRRYSYECSEYETCSTPVVYGFGLQLRILHRKMFSVTVL